MFLSCSVDVHPNSSFHFHAQTAHLHLPNRQIPPFPRKHHPPPLFSTPPVRSRAPLARRTDRRCHRARRSCWRRRIPRPRRQRFTTSRRISRYAKPTDPPQNPQSRPTLLPRIIPIRHGSVCPVQCESRARTLAFPGEKYFGKVGREEGGVDGVVWCAHRGQLGCVWGGGNTGSGRRRRRGRRERRCVECKE